MKNKETFCEYCRKDVLYTEKDEYISAELKGETYNYYGKVAVCDECTNEIFVNEINDYNLKQLYNEFRKQHNIISLEKIMEIPQKYNIGKRPLSLLLGWGEQTFSRYYDGDMPTQQYSAILQKIYEEPEYYLSILESNKDKLKSQSSYEKSKLRAQMLLGTQQISDTEKIEVVVNYLLSKCEDITPLALQKLLYYVQGFYYAFVNQFIFDENCEAWIHGPVFREVYFKYREYRFDPISVSDTVLDFNLTVSEKAIIDSVIKNLSCYSGKILEAFTHAETPWLATRGDLPATVSTDRKIEKKLISDYFTAVKEKNNMLNPSDIGVYSKKMFEQIFM
jgi:putative zinc finger/helix-turn-helix YgiT family protein